MESVGTFAPRQQKRMEIQALRALAVALVLAYHAFPFRVPGGYVGVDVFFVISGYLICGHILAELADTGRVRVARFWARRARRLLPASLLVLLVSAIATFAFVPRHLWNQFLSEISASALYVQNWFLASSSVDYMGSTNRASVAQHFWSLSVEEQFYIVLPLVVLLIALTVPLRWRTRTLGIVLAVVVVVGLAHSVLLTASDPGVAYFSTATRAWEFAAGGLLSFVAIAPRFPAILTWVGLAAIAASALLYNEETAFPGIASALPVLGTISVIASRGVGARRLTDLRAVQYLGDISYSVYLWHWPLLVVLPLALHVPPTSVLNAVALAISVALAAATKVLVEDPLRRPAPWTSRTWPSFGMAVLGAVVIVAIAATGIRLEGERLAAARQVETATSDGAFYADPVALKCWGANAVGNDCAVPDVIDDPALAATDTHPIIEGDCSGGEIVAPILDDLECVYGNPDGATTVVLFGDSHARQWMGAMQDIAEYRDWRLVTFIRSSCPIGDFWVDIDTTECEVWRKEAVERIVAMQPSLVIATSLTGSGYRVVEQIASDEKQLSGSIKTLSEIIDGGIDVVVIKDSPYLPVRAPDCLAMSDPDGCTFPAAQVHSAQDSLSEAAVEIGVPVVSFDDVYCPDGVCPTVIGGVVVYWDSYHLTNTFSRSLAPLLVEELDALGVPRLGAPPP